MSLAGMGEGMRVSWVGWVRVSWVGGILVGMGEGIRLGGHG